MNEIESKINYKFNETHLLAIAITHRSFSNENYEKLEFLGDSILSFVISEILFKTSLFTEGEMSKIRANIVSAQNLSICFDKLDIEDMVLKGGAFHEEVSTSIKSDVMEAIIGAVFVDGGIESAKKVINKIIDLSDLKSFLISDYKSEFQELAQSKGLLGYEYCVVSINGEHHCPTFEVKLFLNGEEISHAFGQSKKIAEQLCAKEGIDFLKSHYFTNK